MASNPAQRRNNPFSRTGSPSPGPGNINGRPKSGIISSPLSGTQSPHNRNQSLSSLAGVLSPNNNATTQYRSNSKTGTPASNTFAPSFIKTEDMQRGVEVIKGIEGENDFSGKRYVWLKDPQTAFVKGWVVEELGNNQILVQCDDGSVGYVLSSWNTMLTYA
jgi:myosin heavy chain 9/10/11/14